MAFGDYVKKKPIPENTKSLTATVAERDYVGKQVSPTARTLVALKKKKRKKAKAEPAANALRALATRSIGKSTITNRYDYDKD